MDRFRALLRDVGRQIATAREARGLTQEQFAEHLGWTPRYYQSIEGGTAAVSLRQLVRVADALELSVAEMFTVPRSRTAKPGRPRRKKPLSSP